MTKFLFVFVLLVLNTGVAIAETSDKCPGEEGFYFTNSKRRNPRAGGFVSNQASVDDDDDVTIEPEAAVCGSSTVVGRVTLFGSAVVKNSRLDGTEKILIGGSAKVKGAQIVGKVEIKDNAEVDGNILVEGSGKGVRIFGNADLYNSSSAREMRILDQAQIFGDANLRGAIVVGDSARVYEKAKLSGTVTIKGASEILGFTKRSSGTLVNERLDDPDYESINAVKAAEEKVKRERERAIAEEILRKNRETAALDNKVRSYRESIEKIFSAGGLKLQFIDHCHFTIKSETKERPFDLTPKSNILDARSKGPRFRYFKEGDDNFLVRFESEWVPNGQKKSNGDPILEYSVYGLTMNKESTADAFVEKLNFLTEFCQTR